MTTPSHRASASTQAEGPRGTPARQDPGKERPSSRPAGPASLVGTTISGRYLIERLIGEGGMGAVYQAQHTHMRKRLAVKVLHPEMSRMTEVVARFEREAMAAAHIEHPNVAAATDFGKLDDGSFFLVLEYVEGKGLREAINDGRMELGRALRIARQIASALGRAHALGIVHRDLKPENVMLVEREGDPDFVKVLDFGIAKVPVGAIGESKVPGQALTQLGMVYGTPEYMAPEQALGQDVDPRADLYALGVILFEMITGRRPFENESKVTLLGMHVTAAIPSMLERAPEANVPPEIDAIVTRLLAKEAGARHADAKELIDTLDAVSLQLAATGRIADPLPPASVLSVPRVSGADLGAHVPAGLARPPVVSLPSLAGSSMAHRVPAPGKWTTGKRLALLGAASATVTLAVIVTVVAFVAHRESVPETTAAVTASPDPSSPPPPPPDPTTDQVVAEAQAKIDKGDFASAIDELTGVESNGPNRADVHMLLERAYTGARNGSSAMREAGLWLAADPKAISDLKLEEDVRNAALFKDSQDDAFPLLESHMGALGVDILYDIAWGNSGKLYPQAAMRARRALDNPEVRGRASFALGLAISFRDSHKTCDQKHAMLPDARDKGDARLLPVLQNFQATRGCGFLSRSDCYPCMHHDHDLGDAIQAITTRTSAAPLR